MNQNVLMVEIEELTSSFSTDTLNFVQHDALPCTRVAETDSTLPETYTVVDSELNEAHEIRSRNCTTTILNENVPSGSGQSQCVADTIITHDESSEIADAMPGGSEGLVETENVIHSGETTENEGTECS